MQPVRTNMTGKTPATSYSPALPSTGEDTPRIEAVLRHLEDHIGQRRFHELFRQKTTLLVREGELIVQVPNRFFQQWLQRRARGPLQEAAHSVFGEQIQIQFEVVETLEVAAAPELSAKVSEETAPPRDQMRLSAPSRTLFGEQAAPAETRATETPLPQEPVPSSFCLKPHLTAPAPAATTTTEKKPAAKSTTAAPRKSRPTTTSANSRTTQEKAPSNGAFPAGRRFADLADFISGPGNELALTAARQVCHSPGVQFNPLFLFGGVGIGKTHLLEGIYRQVRRLHPTMRVLYLTAEQFTNNFTAALREHGMPGFRQKMRATDLLLFDDLDFLESKRGVQEEFLHTFQHLTAHGKQFVITASRHPRMLTKLADELKTRFLSGLVCRLDPPDLETRKKIVTAKAARLGGDFSPEALNHVAQRFPHSIRELEGALHTLQAQFNLQQRRVTLATAREALTDLERDCTKAVRLIDVELVVSELFGLPAEALKSASRARHVSQPRMLAMYLARRHTRAAYGEIGAFFGGRNHSTVMSAERKIRDWVAEGTTVQIAAQTWEMAELIETLERQLQAG